MNLTVLLMLPMTLNFYSAVSSLILQSTCVFNCIPFTLNLQTKSHGSQGTLSTLLISRAFAMDCRRIHSRQRLSHTRHTYCYRVHADIYRWAVHSHSRMRRIRKTRTCVHHRCAHDLNFSLCMLDNSIPRFQSLPPPPLCLPHSPSLSATLWQHPFCRNRHG